MELRGIPFRTKEELLVHYKNRVLQKRYIPDLIVHDRIIVELKSVSSLAADHAEQIINYLRIARRPLGYLINFGPIGKLEWKRLLSEFLSDP